MEEWRNGISTEMIRVHRELIANKSQMAKTSNLAEYIFLRAPCEAIVHEIAALSPGSAAREAEPLITLVPLNGLIELEAEVSPQDIGKVSVGADVRVKVNAFAFQKYGTLDGRIRSISENTFRRQPGDLRATDTSAEYYKAVVTLSGDRKSTRLNSSHRLLSRMPSSA